MRSVRPGEAMAVPASKPSHQPPGGLIQIAGTVPDTDIWNRGVLSDAQCAIIADHPSPTESPPIWNKSAPRTVLVLASRFPPVASVGATRVRKFVKYLGHYGWKPVVITGAMRRENSTAQEARRSTDEESLLDLPEGLPVHRLSPVLDHWPTHFSRAAAIRMAPSTGWLGLDSARWEAGLNWRFQKIHDRLSFPDRGIWRLGSALRLALKLHDRYRFDAIFSSGMPFSDHVVALAVRSVLRRPWLADFRDPWVEYIHWRQWRSELGRRMTRWAEAAVVARASAVISVNDPMCRRFATRYSTGEGEKFVTISNGFDPADYRQTTQPKPHLHFRLIYAGSLYKTRSPAKLIEAFRLFLRQTPGSREHARFEFLGRSGPHSGLLNDPGDADTLRSLGMCSHAAASRALAEADLNVVVLPNVPGSENDTTTKIYESLGSGRPILAAVPLNGAAADVLRPFDGVTLCDPDDVAAIARGMTDCYRKWLKGTVNVSRSQSALEPLTRHHQAGQLAACLDQAVHETTSAGGATP